MPSNYINYADYVGANQDQIKKMEDALRADEQRNLQDAYNATDSAGDEAKARAYWGEMGGSEENLNDFGAWQQAQDKQKVAQQYQQELRDDAGQVNLLNKRKGGGGYGNLDAALVFGSNKPTVEGGNGKGVTLSEYMGYNAADLDKMDSDIQSSVASNANDYQREFSRQQSENASAKAGEDKMALYNKWVEPAKASGLKWANASGQGWFGEDQLDSRKSSALASEMKKKKELGRDFYAAPDWEEYTNWLSGTGTWDKNKEAGWKKTLLGDKEAWDKGGWVKWASSNSGPYGGRNPGDERAQKEMLAKLAAQGLDPWAPDAPSRGYSGRLSNTRQKWEDEGGTY